MAESIRVLSPVTPLAEPVSADAAPPLDRTRPVRALLLSNGKINGTELLEAIATHLAADLDLTLARYRKGAINIPMAPEDFEAAVGEYDAVVTAIGDCGSCSTRTIRDAIDFERAGVPAVAIIADALVSPVQFMCQAAGMPDYPYCVTAFPIGNLTPAQLDERAQTLAPQVLDLLTAKARA